jgi:hypothetical protein
MNVARSLASALILGGTVFSAPAFAHSAVIVPAVCPNKGPNTVRWITVRGHHALSISSDDGGNWAGFEVFPLTSGILHGRIPVLSTTRLPTGTFSFRVLSSSASDPNFWFAETSTSGCFFFNHGSFFPSNGIVSTPIEPETGKIILYINSTTPDSAIVTDFRINGALLPGVATTDESNAIPSSFCNDDASACP